MRLKPWKAWLIAFLVFEAIYYALAGSGAGIYAEACGKSIQYGHQNCPLYDVQSAVVWRAFIFLDDYGAAVAGLAGLAVAAFTLALWRSTEKLWGEAQNQRRDIRKGGLASVVAARAALRSSRAAEKSASAADRQANMLASQTEILRVQKEIQRLQHYSDHRPCLVVRDVYFTNRHDFKSITFEVSNKGGTPLTIREALVRLWFMEPDEVRAFKFVGDGNSGPIPMTDYIGPVLPNGITWPIVSDVPDMVQRRLNDPNDNTKLRLYLFGIFTYDDGAGEPDVITREAVFRREYDPRKKAFRRTDNPDYEYSD